MTSSLRVPDEYAQEYLSTKGGVALKPTTVETYDSQLTEYTTFLNGRGKSTIRAEFTDVIEFIEECVRRGNRRSTISGKLSVIAELYRFIRLRTEMGDQLNFDPLRFREVNLDQYNVPDPIERVALSKEEIRQLFDGFDSYRNRLMAIVGVETGLRNSDLRNLRLKDIDSNQIFVSDPKNSKPYDVPISEQLSFEFNVWFKRHRPGFTAASESEYAFPSQHGVKLSQNSSLNEVIKRAAENAGIQDVIGKSSLSKKQQKVLGTDKEYCEWSRVTVHTLRHSFITLLGEAGVSIPYRQLVANHSDATTTLGYTHGAENVFDEIRSQYDPPR